ncbi:MAG: type IV secretory system conjugative DNA transfer family protein [Hyphomonadaceae bacterium]
MAMQFTTKQVVQMSLLVLCVSVLGSVGATQTLAHIFRYQAALGDALSVHGVRLYWPWAWLEWEREWGSDYPRPFALASLVGGTGLALALIAPALLLRRALALRPFGKDAWACFPDIAAAGLFASQGAILGKLDGEIIAFDGPEHQILIGASRSGKGRGHVIPTLLSWSGSALVLDVKGELDHGDARHGFPGTSGFRAKLGLVIRFAPTDPRSNCFNSLMEVRLGANEVRDVQNIVEMIVEPKGETKGAEQFWNASAKIVITGVILHVLYAEPLERKTFAVVREKLRDLDKTAEEMRLTLHRKHPQTGEPQVHPEVLHAAESYLAGEERLRSGIKATAESFFGLFADPIIAANTARSDFRIGDLMCADKPVTLYLQPPPSDAQRLVPLMRLFINQVARSLMEDQTHDALGRKKNHRLLMALDEFPQLGRLPFFESMMGAMAGYGLKAYLVCQSLNHLTKAYGRENVILDNCAIVTSFAAADPETAERIAQMAGEVWEVRPTQTEYRPRAILGPHKGSISYREERRPLMLPADVRGLPRDEQLIFASGMKPLRAKKLRFDAEPIFAQRLLPPAPRCEGLSHTHDWVDVKPLGKLPSERKPVSSSQQPRRARVATPPKPQPVAAQVDLFGETVAVPPPPPPPPGRKLSEIALAGFRDINADEALPPPPPPIPADAPPRRARATGV